MHSPNATTLVQLAHFTLTASFISCRDSNQLVDWLESIFFLKAAILKHVYFSKIERNKNMNFQCLKLFLFFKRFLKFVKIVRRFTRGFDTLILMNDPALLTTSYWNHIILCENIFQQRRSEINH